MTSIRPATLAFLLGVVIALPSAGQSLPLTDHWDLLPNSDEANGHDDDPRYGDSRNRDDDRRDDDDRSDDDRRGYNDRDDDDRDRYGRDYDDRRYYDQDHDDRYSPRAEVGFFYDELSPYGDWVPTRDYGWAWFPRDVHPYWRPYSDGRWVNTDYGWTWVSNEPFGWATYHYGRWTQDPRYGWLWVPGTIWGPAWVSWQHGGGYLGWAPLPPSVGFEVGIGIRLGGFDLNVGIRPDAYTFVPERSFLEPRVSSHFVSRARNVTIIHNTTNITNYTWNDNRVINRGIDVARLERVTGRRVNSLRVAGGNARNRSEVAASEVRIYRPDRKKLDAVKVGPRANSGRKADRPLQARRDDGPTPARRDPAQVDVAPRVNPAPRGDVRQLDRRDRQSQQELERFQVEEKRKLQKLHGQQIAAARVPADRTQVEKRQLAERQALQEEQKNEGRQLEARQKAKRQAALENSKDQPAPKGKGRAADPKRADKDKPKGAPRPPTR